MKYEQVALNLGNKVKIVDLFAGMGGLRLSVEKAFCEIGVEVECVLTSEIKESAIAALKRNFTHKKMVGDITKVECSEIEDFDILLAGFPCQPFSYAGKREGFGDKTRGTLFFEIERILKDKKPKAFILENVEGLVDHDKENKNDEMGRTLKTILETLKSLKYNVNWRVLNSADFGVPQTRNRIFIVGTRNVKIDLENFPLKRVNLESILQQGLETVNSHFTRCLFNHYKPEQLYGKAIKDKRGGDNNIHSWDIGLKGEITKEQQVLLETLFKERRKKKWALEIGIKWMDGMPLTKKQIQTFYPKSNLQDMLDDLTSKGYLKLEHPREEVTIDNMKKRVPDETKEKGYNIVAGKLSFEFTKILDPNDIAPTLVAMDVGKIGIIDNNGIRQLSIREGLRMCGYPESYELDMFDNKKDRGKAFDLLGNTVVINVVKSIADRLAMIYKNEYLN